MEDEKHDATEPATDTESDVSGDDQLHVELSEVYRLGADLPWPDIPQDDPWQEDEESTRKRAEALKLVSAFAKAVFVEQFRIRLLQDKIMMALDGSEVLDTKYVYHLLDEAQSSYEGIQCRALKWDSLLRNPELRGSGFNRLRKMVQKIGDDIDGEAFVTDDLIRYSKELEVILSDIFLRDERKRLERLHYDFSDSAALHCSTDFANTIKDLQSVMTRLGEVSSLLEEYAQQI